MNQPIITRNPIAVVDAAHAALQAARKDYNDARKTAESVDITTPLAEGDGARARLEYQTESLRRSERVFVAVLAEHGARAALPLDVESRAALAAYDRQRRLMAALVDIAEREEYTSTGIRYHHTAMRDRLAVLPEAIGACLLRAWRAWYDARETARQVHVLRSHQPPRIQWFIDTDRADEERSEAWTTYRSMDGAPQSLDAYAWPGGYTLYYVVETDSTTLDLCPRCAADEEPIASFQQEGHQEGPPIVCEGCNTPIESDYGEPDAEDGQPDLDETRLSVWCERDRLSISLQDTRHDDRHIITLWDHAAHEAIEDGFIKIGRYGLREEDSVLHASVYEYARDNGMLDSSFTGDRDIRPDPESGEDPDITEDETDEDGSQD